MRTPSAREAAIWATKKAGIEIRRKPPILVRSRHELHLNPELLAADLETAKISEPRTVVQIGAFDASANDPVSSIIARFGWRAVLVEPQPEPFQRVQEAYAESESVEVYNVALSDEIGVRTLYTVPAHPGLPEWTQQVASFDLEHVRRQQASLPDSIDLARHIHPLEVQAWTFDRLLAEASVTRVDMLQVDTEGYDYEVLRLFDLARWKPAIVNYEHAHLSRQDQQATARLLIHHGYKLSMSFEVGKADTLAYRRDPAF